LVLIMVASSFFAQRLENFLSGSVQLALVFRLWGGDELMKHMC
jgi:hypothetical protein